MNKLPVPLTGNLADFSGGGGAFQGMLNNCTITGNTASAGGGTSQSTLNNCTLAGNWAGSTGGGADGGILNNCTVSGNAAGTHGGGTYDGALRNCIVNSNASGIGPNYAGDPSFSYSCTTPLPAGTGNITNGPQFVNAGADNYHLLASSPCRDTGNKAYAPGTTDLDGNARIVKGSVDMGAFEYDPTTATYDSDADGFSDQQEYFADMQATNAASFFPNAALTNAPGGTMALAISLTSTGRIYGVFATTNLLNASQTWTLVPPEVPGTGANLVMTIMDAGPFRAYRIGVRLP